MQSFRVFSPTEKQLRIEEKSLSVGDNSGQLSIEFERIVGITHAFNNYEIPKSFSDAAGAYFTPQSPTMAFIIHVLNWKNEKKRIPKYCGYAFNADSVEISMEIISIVRMKAGLCREDGKNKVIKVLLNPFGGRKKSMKIYNEHVKPMFTLANIEIDLQVSEYPQHVMKIVAEMNLTQYDAIITVSGDGLFHELITTLLTRPDWEDVRKIPVGMIGAGTSSALNKNTDSLHPICGTFAVIKGNHRPIDVFSVTQGDKVVYSHLSLIWGLIADIDLESEKIRWAGNARLHIYAALRTISQRTYNGSFYYLTGEEAEKLEKSEIEPKSDHIGPPLTYTNHDFKQWKKEEGPFSLFNLVNLPFIDPECLISPRSRLDDGLLELVWAPELPRLEMLSMLLNAEKAGHLTNLKIQTRQIKSLVLYPGKRVDNSKKNGFLSLSGELIPYAPLRIEAHSKMLNLLVPFWLDEDENTKI